MNNFEISNKVKTYFGKELYIKSIGEENGDLDMNILDILIEKFSK